MSNKTVPIRITTSGAPTTAYISPSNTARLDSIKTVANSATTSGKIKIELVRSGTPYTIGWITVQATNPTTGLYFENYFLLEQIVFLTGDTIRLTTHESITYDFFLFVTE
jgi:hypothetical protein